MVMRELSPFPRSIESPMLIGGRRVHGSRLTPVVNPANFDQTVGSVADGTPDDAEAALLAARDAFPGWSARGLAERGALLRQMAQAVLEDAAGRARFLVRESGKVLAEAEGEIKAGSRVLSYYGELAETFELLEELPTPNGRVVVARESMGVVVVIVPWNAPILLAMLSIAPALLAGNTVVVKPSSDAPLALMDFIRVMDRHLPPGVMNVVTGEGSAAGHALVTHPLTNRVMFTGSTEVGRAIAAASTASLKRVSLELGGNDPALVLADADLDGDVIPELIAAVFPTSGQVCYAVKRIYVQAPLFADFVERFAAAADRLVVGDGLDPRSDMGPLINARQLGFVESLVEDARDRGAHVSELGNQLDPAMWDRGYFHRPTVVTDIAQSAPLVQREQFGPVIPILPFESVDEGLALANDTEYGLAGSVWSSDEELAFRLARRIEAGTTFVNTHRPGSSGVDMPFGGMKQSGIGRGHGVVALEEQFELHTLSSRRPLPRTAEDD